jgi:hypothetical protein
LGISIKKGRGMRMTSIKMVLLTAMVLSRLIMADQNEDMRALRPDALSYPGSTPEIVSPFDSAELQEIQQCVCQLKTIVESGFDYVESQIDYIESQIDILLGCAVTPIQGSIVITVPGSYCLANDITGDIEIAVSGVTLWLNECQISGSIIVDADLQNISISGGAIDPNLLADGLTIGDGCDNVRISNITIRNGVKGLNAVGVFGNSISNLFISGVVVESCSNDGIVLIECTAELTNCLALNNVGSGIICLGTGSIVTVADSRAYSNNGWGFGFVDGSYKCINSFADSNGIVGFLVSGTPDSSNASVLICENCYGTSNGLISAPNGYNFYVGYYSSMIAQNCVAVGGTFGFLAQWGANIEWVNCLAKRNLSDGFVINGQDVLGQAIITGLVSNCISIENVGSGFIIPYTAFSDVRFISNYAVDNGDGNYVTGTTTTLTNTAPYYWLDWNDASANPFNNVDGSNV